MGKANKEPKLVEHVNCMLRHHTVIDSDGGEDQKMRKRGSIKRGDEGSEAGTRSDLLWVGVGRRIYNLRFNLGVDVNTNLQ